MDYLTQLLICQFLLATFSFALIPSIMPYVYKKYAVTNTMIFLLCTHLSKTIIDE
jgi:hypothetical protein